jgi:hypothetical protein
MKFSISRHHGILGLFYCPGTKGLELNLTPRFGLRLQFEFSDAEKTAQAKNLLGYIQSKAGIAALSNEELVYKVAGRSAADDDLVIEMMTRLDPDWFSEESEQAGEDRFTINPSAASTGSLQDG